MSDYHRGPLNTYELTWKSGHIEQVQGHQVRFDSWALGGFTSSLFGGSATQEKGEPHFFIHGEFNCGEEKCDGHWKLVLSAPEKELHTFRDISGASVV